MHTEYLVVDDGRQGEVVKDVAAVAPDIDRPVLAQALVVEPVHLRDLPRLVIPPNEGNAIRIPHLLRRISEQNETHKGDLCRP